MRRVRPRPRQQRERKRIGCRDPRSKRAPAPGSHGILRRFRRLLTRGTRVGSEGKSGPRSAGARFGVHSATTPNRRRDPMWQNLPLGQSGQCGYTSAQRGRLTPNYWLERLLAMSLKVKMRSLPTALKAPIAASEISAAMRPYSMAETPLSSLIKRASTCISHSG